MKSSKIFALALAALTMTACSDDDNDFSYNNKGDVYVQMAETNVEVMENTGIFTVPIVVSGERNGYVRVTVECVETGTDPAIANRHYLLTNDVINIADDDKTAEVEFATVDFRGLDPSRTFNVTIVDVEGAEIGANATTTVQINDKGSAPLYNDLAGQWFISGNKYDFQTGGFNIPFFDQVSATANDPDGEGGGNVTISGVMGGMNLILHYAYDNEEKYGELEFVFGTEAIPGQAVWCNEAGQTDLAPVRGKWNFDFTAVTIGTPESFFGAGAFQDGQFAGFYGLMNGFTLTKIQD